MSRLSLLEDFDAPPPAPDGPLPGWDAGYQAGLAAAAAQTAAAQNRLSDETAQALADLSFSLTGVEQLVLAQLTPLLRLICDKVVPQVLQDTLGVALAEEMIAAARDDLAPRLELRLPPASCAPVAAIARSVAGCAVTVTPDPQLRDGQALLTTPQGDTAFDMLRLHDDIADAITALCAEPPRTSAHA